ncbi:hypothetical protein CHARACLAT_032368, partial [Characodon lateralis]|nr:hypothetical protein [Characodon lateralis]
HVIIPDVKLPALCNKHLSVTQGNAVPPVIMVCLRKSDMKWNTLYLLTLFTGFSRTRALSCEAVVSNCWNQDPTVWTRCYEDEITTCLRRSRSSFFFRREVNLSEQVRS